MKFFLLGLAAGLLLLLLFNNLGFGSRTEQPIRFNHKKHLEQGLECDSCHRYVKTQPFAGMPDIGTCLQCHQEAITKNPEEEKIRQFAKRGGEIPWKRLYKEPDYVFYSHRRHTVLGKIPCQTCHGNIGKSERPPSKPYVRMTMGWCMGCHRKKGASNDCLACHE